MGDSADPPPHIPRLPFTGWLFTLAVVASLVLVVMAVIQDFRGKERAIHCGKSQAQLLGALLAYDTVNDLGAWGFVDPRALAQPSPATRGRLVTTGIFERVALDHALPNALFRCPAGSAAAPIGKPAPGDPASNWGRQSGHVVGYALDWAAHIDAPASRVILADRDPLAHGTVVSSILGGGSLVMVFGDGHSRRGKVVPHPPQRGAGALVTEGVAGIGIALSTGAMPDDDIYSTEGDGGDPLTPGEGDPLRAWVK